MTTPVLVTKIVIPARRQRSVARPHLVALLTEGRVNNLTLVSAPAGFGKTTLLSTWATDLGLPTAWVSLDEDDNDPTRFLAYVVAALETVSPGLGGTWSAALRSAQPPSIETVLVSLINEISALPGPVVLVLDDYHATDSAAVDTALAYLLEHLPRQLHLVIATLEDPDLPVARLRARGLVTELRAADLRFTTTEAAEYLNSVMGLTLSHEDVGRLEQRTEGWIAGLQLAALSMRGRPDASGFIDDFAGDHRYIADYLVGEVLGRQPADVRRFLLQTAVLDRMTGALCDAVTGLPDSQARLAALERGNYFVVPLDESRRWYRYHHLFAEVLRAYLAQERPAEIPALHSRASAWYDRIGAPGEAIRHALAAQDHERAADLVERAAPATHRTRREATALGWFRALPEEVFRRRPVLSAFYAATLLVSGELDGVEQHLRDAERWLEPSADGAAGPGDELVVVDTDAYRHLPASIAMWRSGLALWAGRTDDTERYARQALELLGDDDHQIRASATALLGLAAWTRGDLDVAFILYAEGRDRLRDGGFLADAVACAITLADIRITQGRLHEAMAIHREGLELATSQGAAVLRGAADMYVGSCELHRELGDLAAATTQLGRGLRLGETAGFPQHPYRWRVAKARLQLAGGDVAGAVELLEAAERVYSNDFSPKVRPVAAMLVRAWLVQGRLPEALRWAHEQRLSATDDLSYLREFEHITLARVLLAQFRSDARSRPALSAARDLLARLLQEADDGKRNGTVIEILVLQALAAHAAGDLPAALLSANRALSLAEREGCVAVFLDEGPPMTALLHAVYRQDRPPPYTHRLLSRTESPGASRGALVDPLSARELDVLRLLSSDLGGPAIARELVVSLHTIRSHTKSIYAKLGVNSRRAAVHRAAQLHLLPAQRGPVG